MVTAHSFTLPRAVKDPRAADVAIRRKENDTTAETFGYLTLTTGFP
jgi:hypothetical protein